MPTLRVLDSLRDVPRDAWDALVGDGSPFLEWDWLSLLEEAKAVGPDSGWIPHHLTLWEGSRLIAACPLYAKDHSRGEFVFDQGWASAAHRAGIPYYEAAGGRAVHTGHRAAASLAQQDVQARATAVFAGALEELCERRARRCT